MHEFHLFEMILFLAQEGCGQLNTDVPPIVPLTVVPTFFQCGDSTQRPGCFGHLFSHAPSSITIL